MRVYLSIVLLCIASLIKAQGLQTYFDYGTFQSPQSGAYVETYLTFIGSSMELKANGNKELQGSIAVSMQFLQADSLIFETKYHLAGVASKDSVKAQSNFIDMQRIPLPEGEYTYLLSIKDLNSEKEANTLEEKFSLAWDKAKVGFSHIEFVAQLNETKTANILTKSGYDVTPYTNDFFPLNMDRLKFYAEIYNTKEVFGASSQYLLQYYVENMDSDQKIQSTLRPSRMNSEEVNVVFGSLDLSQIPSGNYNVVIEVRNRKNELVAKHKRMFQRSNPGVSLSNDDLSSLNITASFVEDMKSIDSLSENIRSLRPISDLQEIDFADNQLEKANRELMQQYFLNFWKRRSPHGPEEAWLRYKEQVDKIQGIYGTRSMKGYQTDRGRVYLKYGQANSQRKFDVMKGKPYEIWQYYRIGRQSNIKFVFVNENPSTQIYRLKHSDAIGEPSDPTWRSKVNLIDLDNVNQNGGMNDPININGQ